MESSLSGSQCPNPCDYWSLKNMKVVTFSAAINQSLLRWSVMESSAIRAKAFLATWWWPSTVETHSLLVFSLCRLLSVATKLSRLAAGIRVVIFWVLWPLLPLDGMMAWVRVGGSYRSIQFLALSHLSHLSFSLTDMWVQSMQRLRPGSCSMPPFGKLKPHSHHVGFTLNMSSQNVKMFMSSSMCGIPI